MGLYIVRVGCTHACDHSRGGGKGMGWGGSDGFCFCLCFHLVFFFLIGQTL